MAVLDEAIKLGDRSKKSHLAEVVTGRPAGVPQLRFRRQHHRGAG